MVGDEDVSANGSYLTRNGVNTMETILTILVLLAVIALIVFTVRNKPAPVDTDGLSQSIALTLSVATGSIQQHFLSLQTTLTEQLGSSIKLTNEMVQNNIGNVLKAVEGNQVSVLKSTDQVGQRLDNATKVINDVQTKLGELSQATKEIKDLGQSVSSLQQLLQAPKLRGGFGEMLLEDLIRQVLPSDHYEIQHRFKSGNTVDILVKTASGAISVDSKFPFENFKKAMQAQSETDKRQAVRLFIADVKRHVDAVALKYILPDEGTFPFAIMYIPIESIYYELIIRDNSVDEEGEVHTYALSKKVILVSPSSFYAYLIAIAYGLRGMQIESSAQDIINGLARVQGDIEKFGLVWSTLGTHLKNSQAKFEEGDRQFLAFGSRVQQLSSGAVLQ